MSQNINIFKDEDIMKFLLKDPKSSMIKELADEYEHNR